MKVENNNNQQNSFDCSNTDNNIMQISSTNISHMATSTSYLSKQIIHRREQMSHPSYSTTNSSNKCIYSWKISNLHFISGINSNYYLLDNATHVSSSDLHGSWSEYKTKMNGVRYYTSQQPQCEMRTYETNISSSHSDAASTAGN